MVSRVAISGRTALPPRAPGQHATRVLSMNRLARLVRPVTRVLRGTTRRRPVVTIVDIRPNQPARRFEVNTAPSREE